MTILTKNEFYALNLQLFAEGSGTGAEGSTADSGSFANSTEGVNGNSTNVQVANAQTTDTDSVVDRKAEFEKLIKGEYKDLYNERVQNTVKSRLKGTQEQVARLESLSPLLEMIGNKYGVDSNDAEALLKAIEDDDSYFADEAMERGITVEELKRIRKIERENADLRRQMEEQTTRENANRLYKTWLDQAEEAKRFFPNLDLEAEMQNEQFRNLLRANIDVKSAYQVIHQDEILGGAMQYAAQTVEKKVTDKIMANGRRPSEAGISSQSASVVKTDVSKLTDADMDELIRKARNGERIVL